MGYDSDDESFLLNLVHELIPFFGTPQGAKHNMDF